MPRTVLLLHRLPLAPSGSASLHVDWLLARDGVQRNADDRVLLAFRCDRRPDRQTAARIRARRLPDHRWAYLTFEGPLAGPASRGSVARLSAGECVIELETEDELRFNTVFDGERSRWRARRAGPTDPATGESDWRIELEAEPTESR